MPEPPVFRVPPPRPSKRRAIDDKIAIAVLILIAVAMVAMLALSHPGENSGVGGRAPTVEEQR